MHGFDIDGKLEVSDELRSVRWDDGGIIMLPAIVKE